MDVKLPIAQKVPCTFWVQFKCGPLDLLTNSPKLRLAVDFIHKKKTIPTSNIKQPSLGKLDCTMDVGGSLYAAGDWKSKHSELKENLDDVFDLTFRDNGNSMDTCFQFVSKVESEDLDMRIKVYWKTLAYIQSESVQKSLGMNLRGIFYPSIRMGLAL